MVNVEQKRLMQARDLVDQLIPIGVETKQLQSCDYSLFVYANWYCSLKAGTELTIRNFDTLM